MRENKVRMQCCVFPNKHDTQTQVLLGVVESYNLIPKYLYIWGLNYSGINLYIFVLHRIVIKYKYTPRKFETIYSQNPSHIQAS